MARPNSMTMVQAIEKILTRVDGPMPVDAFIKRVLAMYRSTAKNPIASVRNKLRTECVGENIVFRDRQTLEPLRLAMQGVRFRIRLTQEEVTQEVLFVASAFEYFQRSRLEPQKMRLQDVSGHTLPCQVKAAAQQVKSVLGTYPREAQAFALGDWYRAHQVEPNDSVLVTIVDWNTGHFQLEHEPANRRRQADITRQNQELADAIYAMLESASSEQIYPRPTIPTAYARLSEPRAYPGDHWTEVLAGDDRMFFDGFSIRYGGVGSIFEGLQDLDAEEPDLQANPPLSPQQARQVYRFKAALKHRPGLWRRVEIQGDQSLADFDQSLRMAFQHDRSDHLAGFWKLVRRGKGNRFREIDLGSLNPFGEGDGDDQYMAELELQPGDELKYVYDFGDWIEHRLTLEEILEPEAKATYPRIVAQNKPQYKYCQECKDKGDKTVATLICIECSDATQQLVVICEDCVLDLHEDHYVDDMRY